MVGNSLADAVAEEAASRVKPDLNCIKAAKRCEMLGFIVAKRLALIQADIWTAKDMAGDIYELDRVLELITCNQTEATHKML